MSITVTYLTATYSVTDSNAAKLGFSHRQDLDARQYAAMVRLLSDQQRERMGLPPRRDYAEAPVARAWVGLWGLVAFVGLCVAFWWVVL